MALPPRSGPRTGLHAWVLGDHATATWLAEELEEEGFEARPWDIPFSVGPAAVDQLRTALQGLAKLVPPAPAGLAHVVHPGVSPWAERPELQLLAQEAGLAVLAPPVKTLQRFSNRLNWLVEAESDGIPTLLLGAHPVHSVSEIEKLAVDAGLPIVLKAVRGGSGLGLHVVPTPEDFAYGLPHWLDQVRSAFGEVILFGERYLEAARQITVPFCRLRDGHIEIFPSVDASLQLRHRKLIEFCPAPGLEPSMERELHGWTRRLAEKAEFTGVGAFEFLVDGGRAYVIEGLARLNTGFALWERVAGTKVVSWQLAAQVGLAAAGAPARAPKKEWKSAASVRLLAEDPVRGVPQPGVVSELSPRRHWPALGASAVLRLAVTEGGEAAPESDGMVGFLLAGGSEREQATSLLRSALGEIWIAGGLQTNQAYLASLLATPWVRDGAFHAAFLDEEFVPEPVPPQALMPVFAAAAREAFEGPTAGIGPTPERWAVNDRVIVAAAIPILMHIGPARRWKNGMSSEIRLLDGSPARVCAHPIQEGRWIVRLGGLSCVVRWAVPRGDKLRKIIALCAGTVEALRVREGGSATSGTTLALLKSGGRLVAHRVAMPVSGVMWRVHAGDRVLQGQVLGEFEGG